jgi:hypothetical protein
MSDEYEFHIITNVPNTTIRTPRHHQPKFTELTGMFEPLLLKLHRRHKNWRFIIIPTVYNYNYPETSNLVAHVYTYDHNTNELLGTLGRNGEQYSVTNFRIKREGKRSDERRSASISKTVQIIEKYFIPKDVTESLRDVSSSTHTAINEIRSTANNAIHRSLAALMHDDTLAAFMLPHLDEIVAAVRTRNTGAAERIKSIPECMVASTDAQAIYDVKVSNKYYIVMIRPNDQYVVADYTDTILTDAPTVITYAAETLPILLRGRVGMLKLTEVNTLIPGVGVRTGPNTFFIPKEV